MVWLMVTTYGPVKVTRPGLATACWYLHDNEGEVIKVIEVVKVIEAIKVIEVVKRAAPQFDPSLFYTHACSPSPSPTVASCLKCRQELGWPSRSSRCFTGISGCTNTMHRTNAVSCTCTEEHGRGG
ncbi:hypothetical protein EYF80_058535 [Liparis tanakae]|uniref:Uncharacterized protein n=1 Tax=Liparis tanakae TaxID=230148 RepID=A0A4Z2ERB7_9TELE|nr:hypothetical protein EYF80_058535 [Liparis tanakae]